ncbi:hypothetical protein A3H26_02125 [candidate division WWE3 bacterium RIFCSPLOWO2_12_FULL_36_10]|uniref:Glycosyltransferase 2-like domain-containing protein n=1 Tax=candidate division WWE3 bacterium RIFCSPLOWO2_12_FULL_36_10 TaxID=1802630 RepID=A0A1F4VJC4_UNCKA|nr:MAG: hypothetical protein A3H26_02125 [candidate division WWE3 bacterium RIFCSPLOWO2_12_FULL_36_10]
METLSVSIVIPTLNSERTLEKCLKSIRGQNYPKNKVEVLIIDGGSTDSTENLATKYNCIFIKGGYKENQEARKAIGLEKASNEIVGYIDSDNILPNKNYISEMITPFNVIPDLVGTETWRYGIDRDFNVYNRYFALLGVNDAVAYYLGKADKIPWFENTWKRGKILSDKKNYTVVEFSEKNLPTVGANGFFIRRELLIKSKCKPDEFFHIDVVYDLLGLGYTKFAMVKNEIYHDTASTIFKLAARRKKYFVNYGTKFSRRYILFDKKNKSDILSLLMFVFYTMTVIQPLLLSIRGYIKKRDVAWFLHPVVCWVFLWAYGSAVLKKI